MAWARAAVVGAALLTLAQPPFGLWPLSLVALVPWLCAASRGRWGAAALGSFAVGTAYPLAAGAWLPASLAALGASRVEGVLGLLVSAAWVKGLPFAAVGVVVFALRRQTVGIRIGATGAAFFAVQELVSSWRWEVPWLLLGHSQIAVLGVAQLALVGGVPLVSGLVAAINQAGALVWEQRGSREAARGLAVVATAWLALALAGLPLAEAQRPHSSPGEAPIRLLLVQPNLPRGERWAPDAQALHVKRIGLFTERALDEIGSPPTAILWPENLLTSSVDTTPALEQALQHWIDRLGAPVILGAVRSSPPEEGMRYRSSVLWMVPRQGTVASIDKARAIPLLESGSEFWGHEWVERAYGAAARWRKVDESAQAGPLRGSFTVAPVLCYEALFPGLVQRRRTAETVAILNLADDSWAVGDMATEQLAAGVRFRAIEQRLPLLRVAHGGLSMVVDPFGRVRERLPLDTYAHALAEVAPESPPALSEKAGLLGLALIPALAVGWALSGWARRGRGEPRSERPV